MLQLQLKLKPDIEKTLVEVVKNDYNGSYEKFIETALKRQKNILSKLICISEDLGNEIEHQKNDFANLLQNLGQGSFEEIEQVLQERKVAKKEKGLSPEVVRRLKKKISKQRVAG